MYNIVRLQSDSYSLHFCLNRTIKSRPVVSHLVGSWGSGEGQSSWQSRYFRNNTLKQGMFNTILNARQISGIAENGSGKSDYTISVTPEMMGLFVLTLEPASIYCFSQRLHQSDV